MKLWKQLRKKPFCNDFHLILIPLLLFLLSLKYWPFFIVLGLFIILLYKKSRLLIPISAFLLIFSLEIGIISLLRQIPIPKEMDGYVLDIKNENSYIILYKGNKIEVSEWMHENKPGDYIHLKIELKEMGEKSYDSDFDSKEYLYGKGISYQAKGKTIKKINSYFSIHTIKYYYISYLKKYLSKESLSYSLAMVFGMNTLEDEVKDSYSILGISHILAISGLHIILLFKIISFILLKVFKYYKKTIPIVFLITYGIIIGAPPSALRAILFVLLGAINKKGEASYTRLDILSISCIGMLLLNPYQIYSSGFILSYLVSFVLIFNRREGGLIGTYKTYILIYFSTFPITINMTNRISLLSFLLSPIFSLILSFILIPISYLVTLFPILDYGLKYIFIFTNSYLEGIVVYNLIIPVPSFDIWKSLFYYIFFIFFIFSIGMKKKIIPPLIIFLSYLLCAININIVNPFYEITYIDCGQGDACLIRLPNNRGNMLIDAYNSYDYIKSLGINTIDILLFSHSDLDHIGDYEKIIKNMNVKRIYAPYSDMKFKEIMASLNITYVKSGDRIKFGDIPMEILGPINPYEDPNSNSIVLKFKINETKYLFAGDMTKEEEHDLAMKYGSLLDSDILKVAHHGSNTSSTKEFLDYVTPKISIVSVAKVNSYNLPIPYIIKRLEEYSIVYKTYECGNITILEGFGKVHISTYR